MNIGSVSSTAEAATQPKAASSPQAAQPHHSHHHAGGAKDTGALTPGTLTSSGSTPVLDTLV